MHVKSHKLVAMEKIGVTKKKSLVDADKATFIYTTTGYIGSLDWKILRNNQYSTVQDRLEKFSSNIFTNQTKGILIISSFMCKTPPIHKRKKTYIHTL